MALPSYADLGKCCKDLFKKGYNFGEIKIGTKNRTCYGTEFSSNSTQQIEDKTVLGEVQIKNIWDSFGFGLTTKWNTDHLLTNEITCADYLARGLKIGLEAKCNLTSGVKSWIPSGQYKIDNATIDLSIEGGDEINLLANASIVAGYKNFVLGHLMGYDTVAGEMKKNNMTAGYLGSGFIGLVKYDNMEVLSGSYYQQVNNRVDTAIQASAKGDEGPTFSIGARYIVDHDGVVARAKVDNQSQLGVGCDIKVTDGVTLSLCGNINLKEFNAGGHKIGLGLEFTNTS